MINAIIIIVIIIAIIVIIIAVIIVIFIIVIIFAIIVIIINNVICGKAKVVLDFIIKTQLLRFTTIVVMYLMQSCLVYKSVLISHLTQHRVYQK